MAKYRAITEDFLINHSALELSIIRDHCLVELTLDDILYRLSTRLNQITGSSKKGSIETYDPEVFIRNNETLKLKLPKFSMLNKKENLLPVSMLKTSHSDPVLEEDESKPIDTTRSSIESMASRDTIDGN